MGAKKGQIRKSNYTPEEIKFVIDNAETMFYGQIGKILNRSKSSVKNIARRFNISSINIRSRTGNRKPKEVSDFIPISKICTKCKVDKKLEEFNKDTFGKFGLKSICKSCQGLKALERYDKKRDEILAYGKEYRKNKGNEMSPQRIAYFLKNKERFSELKKIWAKNNPGKVNAKTAKRRAAKRNATPSWLTDLHWDQIECFYIEAAKLTKEIGIPHEVDHIVPVMGKDVCGLHVPWNLQILTRSGNRKKGRKF